MPVKERAADVAWVQFLHPGAEHRAPAGGLMGWHGGDHARKFMVCQGAWIAPDRREDFGRVTFWGEWEPPSRVLDQHPRAPREPRFLHQPLRPPAVPAGQNTDPFVFAESFRYTNCRQQRNRKLRCLPVGSVILFGSKLRGQFVLDTVIVVAERSPLAAAVGRRRSSSAFQRAVVQPLVAAGIDLGQYTHYRGATPGQPVNGMFSFAPADPYRADWGFARPPIQFPNLEPNLAMGAKITYVRPGRARSMWEHVAAQVQDRGLVLGIRFDISAATARSAAPGAARC